MVPAITQMHAGTLDMQPSSLVHVHFGVVLIINFIEHTTDRESGRSGTKTSSHECVSARLLDGSCTV